MEADDRLRQVIDQVAMSLDEASSGDGATLTTPEKYGKILADSGHSESGHLQERKMDGCSGTFRGRPVTVYFHRNGEMSISARCEVPCRFRMVPRTLGARLNFLQGRRIMSGDQMFDRQFVIRSAGRCGLDMFFQRSDVTSSMHGLLPFYSLTSEPGSMSLASDFDRDEIRADRIIGRLEALVELADTLEEAMADRIAILDGEEAPFERGKEGER
ncbi:MAG: hypothetical protein R6U39_00845 [Candidatus Aegiribacteria sp.]